VREWERRTRQERREERWPAWSQHHERQRRRLFQRMRDLLGQFQRQREQQRQQERSHRQERDVRKESDLWHLWESSQTHWLQNGFPVREGAASEERRERRRREGEDRGDVREEREWEGVPEWDRHDGYSQQCDWLCPKVDHRKSKLYAKREQWSSQTQREMQRQRDQQPQQQRSQRRECGRRRVEGVSSHERSLDEVHRHLWGSNQILPSTPFAGTWDTESEWEWRGQGREEREMLLNEVSPKKSIWEHAMDPIVHLTVSRRRRRDCVTAVRDGGCGCGGGGRYEREERRRHRDTGAVASHHVFFRSSLL
jgi:hypothetical protein